jgi:hypothetical protein
MNGDTMCVHIVIVDSKAGPWPILTAAGTLEDGKTALDSRKP